MSLTAAGARPVVAPALPRPRLEPRAARGGGGDSGAQGGRAASPRARRPLSPRTARRGGGGEEEGGGQRARRCAEPRQAASGHAAAAAAAERARGPAEGGGGGEASGEAGNRCVEAPAWGAECRISRTPFLASGPSRRGGSSTRGQPAAVAGRGQGPPPGRRCARGGARLGPQAAHHGGGDALPARGEQAPRGVAEGQGERGPHPRQSGGGGGRGVGPRAQPAQQRRVSGAWSCH